VTTYHDEAIAALARVRAASMHCAGCLRTALDDARVPPAGAYQPIYIVKNKPVAPKRRLRKQAGKPPQAVTPKDSKLVG